jgi:uncharacterized membrane protein
MRHPLSPYRASALLAPLIFTSVVCLMLILARGAAATHWRFTGLFGNLVLAWIPVGLAFGFDWLARRPAPRPGHLWACGLAWLFFFPNSSYIVTDLVHFKKWGQDGIPKWFDLLLINAHAFCGVFLGSLALYIVTGCVRQRFGSRASAVFAVGVLALGAFGIYLGRFLRLNSWDVLVRPFKLLTDVAELGSPMKSAEVAAFTLVFFLFNVCAYWFIAAALHHEDPA